MRGSVLILSLWAMSILTSLTVTQAGTVGMSWRLIEQPRALATAARLARQAVDHRLAALQADAGGAWDAPSEPWGQATEQTGAEGAWSVRVEDEGGRINVNTASPDLLAQLPESSEFLAEAIALARAQQPLRHLAELALIPGVTPEHLAAWDSLVTVIGRGAVNLNSAPAGVLEALGLSPTAAAQITAWRNGADGQLGTSDDQVFHEAAEISPAVSAFLQPDEAAALAALIATGQLDVRSSAFRLIATATAGARPMTTTVTALIERQAPGRPPTIRGWHEDT